jgi:type I restriction enzyme M protein
MEPYHGRIPDPARGYGGMLVHGQERVTDTARLGRMNLAVHGLSGDIKQGNTNYEDLQESIGRFDFVPMLP